MKDYIKSVSGRWGKTHYVKKDIYIGASIENYGEYNPDETEMIISLATERAGRVLDIGANFGVISQALLASGVAKVETFEPQTPLYEIVCLNCAKANNHNVAVGAVEGTVAIPKVKYSKPNNFGGLAVVESGMGMPTRCITIDSLGFDDVVCMKIDVEGYEENVLRGATATIKRCKPILYVENDRQEKSASLEQYIESLGYTWEWHIPTLYRENNYFGKKKFIWAGKHPVDLASYNIICRPGN